MKKMFGFGLAFLFVLLFGVLAGVQYMNEQAGRSIPVPLNISTETNVSKESTTQTPSTVVTESRQTVNATNDLIEKKERAKEVGNFNFFSDLGGYLSSSFHKMCRSTLEAVMGFVHHMFTGETDG
ncbi:hypothetical protein AJ85_02745 [Alkalihalobacillus alcalophilus ATCC 27647 = CGMCC 1.3604]|uniref:DUF3679 domain-containing protein n=1 Tax=Alkalihalobacillus alcalophilus ATCC 27647 = CGMCC 1.3604 TaxID=1218173 RepID=A0A094YY43_ALKAL|nr:hypothetical protein [Alkalihalobacillus alcalophilus]KGA98457.1 hypothetical protein BALCAV_0204315 [Alkalihalobacillus alcalophilus ATCC 27647 = CGMCC 1.3604]MED1563339.1 hypothetical protein [Alkalihalobacillus alcalophilus]THG88549.1 hypothetical protein AJ85_02745 [Alkalihalobacillus alcalophilus ATCC 27647 = CGMCC 1.3604]